MKDAASRQERIAVLVFALARTLLCGYRAATQSITVDEATTYLNYVREHLANVWANYDPNNHVLYSILAQLSVRALHISEFSLRLPSVLAGFFFVLGMHRVLAVAVPSAAIRWITLLGVGLAPLMLDFSVAARGYGLGLALLTWAIYFSMRGRDFTAGVLAGLSIAATFNLAYPALGLIACPVALGRGRIAMRFRRSLAVAAAAGGVSLAICFPLFRQIHIAQLYAGEPEIRAALYNLVFLTIRAVPGHPGLFGTGTGTRVLQYFLLPAILLFTIAVSIREFRREPRLRRVLLSPLTLLVSLAGIIAGHVFLGLNYPVDRLGLYLFLLLALSWAIAAARVANPRILALNAALAVILSAQFLTQFHTRFFALWTFDSAINLVARRLANETRDKPAGSISVSATWFHTPALEFYRHVYRMTALRPVERHQHTELTGFDYYVLNLKDDDDLRGRPAPNLTSLFTDDLSGALLAK
ncbi:MAG TPA: hypothetical protein VFW40_09030 [Capsulimonadaceae bacterium]|nr:hypothetical protein [Capsulimonadaceae bacterium]